MRWWAKRANDNQLRVRMLEMDHEERFDKGDIERAIVYMRQDMVLIASYLDSLNEQIFLIRRAIKVVVVSVSIGLAAIIYGTL